MAVSAEDLTYIEYEGKRYVSVEEAIRYTGYKLNTLYVYRYRGEIRTYSLPGYARRKFFLLDELVAFNKRERYPQKAKPQPTPSPMPGLMSPISEVGMPSPSSLGAFLHDLGITMRIAAQAVNRLALVHMKSAGIDYSEEDDDKGEGSANDVQSHIDRYQPLFDLIDRQTKG